MFKCVSCTEQEFHNKYYMYLQASSIKQYKTLIETIKIPLRHITLDSFKNSIILDPDHLRVYIGLSYHETKKYTYVISDFFFDDLDVGLFPATYFNGKITSYIPLQLTKKHIQEFPEESKEFKFIAANTPKNREFAKKYLTFSKIDLIETCEMDTATPSDPVLCATDIDNCVTYLIATKTGNRACVHLSPKFFNIRMRWSNSKSELAKINKEIEEAILDVLEETAPKKLVVIHKYSKIDGNATKPFYMFLTQKYKFENIPFIRTKHTHFKSDVFFKSKSFSDSLNIYFKPNLEVIIEYQYNSNLSRSCKPFLPYTVNEKLLHTSQVQLMKKNIIKVYSI